MIRKRKFIFLGFFLVFFSCQKTSSDGSVANNETKPNTQEQNNESKDSDDNSVENHWINVYTRDTVSGTREAFFQAIDFEDAKDDDSFLRDDVVIVSGNADMITKITNDENSIGYISLTSLTDDLNPLKVDGIEATEENALNGSYPLSRDFSWVAQTDIEKEHVTEKTSAIIKAFLDYIKSIEGVSILQNEGIITEGSDELSEFPIDDYPVCQEDNSEVTVYFGGSTSVEKSAKGLTSEFRILCGNFVADHNHTGSGDSVKVQDSLHMGFASRALKESEVTVASESGTLGKDAIAVVVNKSNNILDNISKENLKRVFSEKEISFEDLI